MTTLREEMARAAYTEFFAGVIGCCEPAWDELLPEHRDRILLAQDAALAVVREHLREPTPAMIEAASHAPVDGCPVDVAAPRIWRAMLAARFEETGR